MITSEMHYYLTPKKINTFSGVFFWAKTAKNDEAQKTLTL